MEVILPPKSDKLFFFQMMSDYGGSTVPAYVCRGVEEREVARGAVVGKDTLKDTFILMKSRLDPPIDEFEAVQRLNEAKWRPGVQVGDLFYRLLRDVKRAKLNPRYACVLMSTQLTKEVQGKAKGELADKDEQTEVQAGDFLVQVKEALIQRGISLDFGYRNFDKIAKLTSEASMSRDALKESIPDEDKLEVANNINIVKQNQSRSQYSRSSRRDQIP